MSRKELKQLKEDLTISWAVATAIYVYGEAEVEELTKVFEESKMLSLKGHMDGTATLSFRLPVESWQNAVEYFQNLLEEYKNTMKDEEEELP